MSLQAGDKVRFLDEKGEGVIARFIDNQRVLVRMDDGFEIPYLLAKLVPAEAPPKPKPGAVPAREDKPGIPAPVRHVNIQSIQTEGVYLVYLPADPEFLVAGNFRVMIFNMTSLHIQVAISTRHLGKFTCEFAGTIEPHQSSSVREIGAGDIERWAVLQTDILFFSYSPFNPRIPISRLLKQKPAKFYKESSFTSSGFTSDPAIVVDLTRTMQKGQEEEYFEEKDLVRIVQEKEHKKERTISVQSEKNNPALEWEVDLHAEELVENLRGMNNGQIIDIQLRHFHKKLDEGLSGSVRKIVFIHGVGNGRLKSEILKILSSHKGLRVQDASYARYGFGATEVVFT